MNENAMVTEEDVREAYTRLHDYMIFYSRAAVDMVNARRKLETERADAISRGMIIGKNQDEREASARSVCAAAYAWLETAETAERSARDTLDMAKLEVEMIRLLVRLMSIGSSTTLAELPQ